MQFARRIPTIILFALAIVGCSSEEPAAQAQASASAQPNEALGPVMQTLNGKPLYESVFRLYSLARLQKPLEDLSDEERNMLLDQLTRLELLAGAAEDRGLDKERTVAAELELQRVQSMARYMATRYLQDNPPTESELREAYEQNLDRFAATQYKARHILLKTEADANEVIQELEGGAEFAELARAKSTGPTGPKGGDLGWFSADTMVAPFANAVRSMTVGTYSQAPVQTQFGWHVILLEDKKEQQPPGLDAVRRDVTNIVSQQKLETFADSLRH